MKAFNKVWRNGLFWKLSQKDIVRIAKFEGVEIEKSKFVPIEHRFLQSLVLSHFLQRYAFLTFNFLFLLGGFVDDLT